MGFRPPGFVRGAASAPHVVLLFCVCGVRSQAMMGQACECGGEGTTIACVLGVCMTCVTWVVVEVVTQELVAVMRHLVEV